MSLDEYLKFLGDSGFDGEGNLRKLRNRARSVRFLQGVHRRPRLLSPLGAMPSTASLNYATVEVCTAVRPKCLPCDRVPQGFAARRRAWYRAAPSPPAGGAMDDFSARADRLAERLSRLQRLPLAV